MANKTIKIVVEGGNVKPGPPLGPTLSQLKLNVGEVVKKINDATASFKGMTVPVTINVDVDTKKYEISVGIPTTTSLLLKKAGAQGPSGDPSHKKVGNVSLDDVIEVSITKKPSLTSKELKGAIKSVLGTAHTIGLTVDNKEPKSLVKEIEEGKYDEIISKYVDKWNGSEA
ncbi:MULTISPECIES: 50S ribosomal protein L11 [Acidianus]|uniref:Large ribosomal subunit protein uL11 n=1 Tax=Candidatus Acidianus copahuensis TaxID=1160895 RepID=A0A031LPJ8_9CREN|nr:MULTISPECIES: 50S ribosomal protein L11 [Acidianus]EZQ06911.1 50S ribosomal protein L11 [Candidatus Acidianus copahuensis]NON61435.1 50S ribosomal protein L11 [Acidianus sp. RZ1]